MDLGQNVLVSRVMNAVAAGTGDTQKGTILDMAGYDGVLLIAALGDCVNTAVATLQVGVATTNDTAQMTADTTNKATVTATATSADNKLLVLDVYRPSAQFVEAQLVRATANVPIDGIIAIRYGAGKKPPATDSTVVAAALKIS